MQTIYVFSRIGYGRRLYEARVGGLLGPYGFALRRFVWKLGLVYAYGDFDKSQRLESIVVEKVIIHSGAPGSHPSQYTRFCSCRWRELALV